MQPRWNFENKDSLLEFNMMIDSYAFQKGIGIMGIDLCKSWELYFANDRQLFYSIIDIKLNILNVFSSSRDLQMLWRRDDIESVFKFNRCWFEFVCSYRSFYDKYMNLVIQSGWKEKFKSFDSAKSKNKSFRKILMDSDTAYIADGVFLNIPKEFTEWCFNFINYVNEEYRTPEVHNAGKAHKWIFTATDEEKKQIEKFNELIKNMWQFLHIIGTIAGGRKFCEQIDIDKKREKSR
jgi:hypothetical protein